jgi:hypothetical protein
MEDEVHRTKVWGATQHYPENKSKFWVECSCGYVGGPFKNKADAENDSDEHILAATN